MKESVDFIGLILFLWFIFWMAKNQDQPEKEESAWEKKQKELDVLWKQLKTRKELNVGQTNNRRG